MLNTTVTESRLAVSDRDGQGGWIVERRQQGFSSLPLELRPLGTFLFFQQRIRVDNDEIILHTCNYRFSTSSDLRHDDAWVLRYEFSLTPLPGQPHAHLHVNAVHKHTAAPMDRLHLPSGLVTIEQFLAHLLLEHGVEPVGSGGAAEAVESLGESHGRFPAARPAALFP
ncbi:MAG: hypothetical protein OXC99_04110 [Chloroflexi bacterium]|nr:hypothetical protein [Chloroflexota bacterium]